MIALKGEIEGNTGATATHRLIRAAGNFDKAPVVRVAAELPGAPEPGLGAGRPRRCARTLRQHLQQATRRAADGYGEASQTLAHKECDEVVRLRDIGAYWRRRHPLLAFYGPAPVAYLPNRRVVGLSKRARTAEVFARRPQVRERTTRQPVPLWTAWSPRRPRGHGDSAPVSYQVRRADAERGGGDVRPAWSIQRLPVVPDRGLGPDQRRPREWGLLNC